MSKSMAYVALGLVGLAGSPAFGQDAGGKTSGAAALLGGATKAPMGAPSDYGALYRWSLGTDPDSTAETSARDAWIRREMREPPPSPFVNPTLRRLKAMGLDPGDQTDSPSRDPYAALRPDQDRSTTNPYGTNASGDPYANRHLHKGDPNDPRQITEEEVDPNDPYHIHHRAGDATDPYDPYRLRHVSGSEADPYDPYALRRHSGNEARTYDPYGLHKLDDPSAASLDPATARDAADAASASLYLPDTGLSSSGGGAVRGYGGSASGTPAGGSYGEANRAARRDPLGIQPYGEGYGASTGAAASPGYGQPKAKTVELNGDPSGLMGFNPYNAQSLLGGKPGAGASAKPRTGAASPGPLDSYLLPKPAY